MAEVNRTPPYMQVVTELRRRITAGEVNEGDRLPSVREIAEDWGISQATALKALQTLKAEGLAEALAGIGTVVRTQQIHRSALDRWRQMLSTGRIYPPGEYAKILSAETVPAPETVAAPLGVETGAEVIARRRVTYNEAGPVSASTSYFTAELGRTVPQLLSMDRIVGGTPSAIREATGRVAAGTSETYMADAATEQHAADLDIEVGSPVLVGRNVLWDQDEHVIEVGEYVSAARRPTTIEHGLA